MARTQRKWRLRDLVDLESRLVEREGGAGGVRHRQRYRAKVAEMRSWPRSEAAKRRVGLRLWLEAGREGDAPGETGQRVVAGLRGASLVLGFVAAFAGIGVSRGLLQAPPADLFARGYNVWLFLAVTVGLQWTILLGGLLGYFLVRRGVGALSLMQRFVSRVALRWFGGGDAALTRNLLEGGGGYRSVLSWRVARLTQGVAVMFNLGLLAGFYGCLFFLSVRFYWESTMEGSGWGLVDFAELVAAPWSWSGVASPPVRDGITYSVVGKIWYEKAEVDSLWPFLMMVMVVYGLLPRMVLWMVCLFRERRALATLPFQAARHRELWRELTKVESHVPSEGQADGVVLIDVGGTEISTGAVREFLLRELRVNPLKRFTAAVLDEDCEREALEAIGEAELGVVLLVEGWALSPKQIGALHERIREMGGAELPVQFLVVGEMADGALTPPTDEEWQQWKGFVDSLRDPASDVVAFRDPAEGGGEA